MDLNLYCTVKHLVKKFLSDSSPTAPTSVTVYSRYPIWAEEGGAANANSGEVSFGNGATGFIGLRLHTGVEVEYLSFHADTFAANARLELNLVDYQNVPSVAAPIIATIAINTASDGGGTVNNAHKVVVFDPPIVIPDNAVLGFRTGAKSGNVSDFRILAMLRDNAQTVVSPVT